jgi:hypothetical protein
MLELILIACFSAFWLAVISQVIDFIESFVDLRVIKALSALLFSVIGAFLVSINDIKEFFIYSVAGAFLSAFLVAGAERIATYRPAVIQAIRSDR